jgi:hypothetical protein
MSSLVVMSKGTKFTQQSYKVSGEAAGVGGGGKRTQGGMQAGRVRQMTATVVADLAGHGA